MPEKQKVNPAPEIPRSQEEAYKAIREKGQEQGLKLIEKVEANNEEIRKSVAIVAMLKCEGWKYFWEKLESYSELMNSNTILSLSGSVLEKGAQVERLQGKLEIMNTIDAEMGHHLKKAKEKPMDAEELRNKAGLNKDK